LKEELGWDIEDGVGVEYMRGRWNERL